MKHTFLAILMGFTANSYAVTPIVPPAVDKEVATLDFFDDCDACGCSANGGSMGYSSMLDDNFIGVRYFHQSYKSRDGVFKNSPWIDENFNTTQIWARIPVANRFEITALVPYHFHNRVKPAATQNIDGLGDITVMGFYTAFKTVNEEQKLQHKVLVGAGVKAPTGKYDSKNNGSVNPSFQVGTGSWDYTLATEYIIRKAAWGFNTSLNYVYKTKNDQAYQFGNQFNYGATLFYTTNWNQLTVVPQLGLAGETYAANKDHQEAVPLTKGDIFFSKLGVEFGYKKFSMGLNAMLPINQNLTGGRVEANYRFAVNINYTL